MTPDVQEGGGGGGCVEGGGGGGRGHAYEHLSFAPLTCQIFCSAHLTLFTTKFLYAEVYSLSLALSILPIHIQN